MPYDQLYLLFAEVEKYYTEYLFRCHSRDILLVDNMNTAANEPLCACLPTTMSE